MKAALNGEESPFATAGNGCEIPYLVSTKNNAGGTIVDGGKNLLVPVDETKMFSVVPNEGFHIVSVSVDGVVKVDASAETVAPYTYTTAYKVSVPDDLVIGLKNKHTIAAKFKGNSYNVTTTAGDGGKITPVGTKVVKHGKVAKYTITPNTGERIVSVKVNGELQTGLPESGKHMLELPITGETDIEVSFVAPVQDPNSIDNDGDGYTETQGDCNDANAAIHPGAVEICGNGIDENCSGADLACVPNATDDDGDGYTQNQGDCNDTDSGRHPGAVEICGDGIDQGCTGADLACPLLSNDYDGDGYTDVQGDCDDFNASVHPGGTDIASDGYDQNCDGQYNGDQVQPATDTQILDATSSALILFVSPEGKITFSSATNQINGLAPGMPLLIGITPFTPMGFMGRVVSTEGTLGGQVVVTTEPASLNEVFETLKVVRKGSLGASGSTTETPARSLSRSLSIGVDGVSAFDDCLDGSPDGVIVNELCLAMQTGYTFDIDIGLFTVNKMTFTATPTATVAHRFGVEGEVEGEHTKDFPQVRYPPIPMGIPGIFVTPVIGASLTTGFKAEGGATITTSRTVAYDAQLVYQDGLWSKSLTQTKDQQEITKEVHASAEVSATISPIVNLYINGVAGPYLQWGLTGTAVAAPCAVPWWVVSVEADYSIGAKVRLLKDLDKEFMKAPILPPTIVDQSAEPFPLKGTVRGAVTDQSGNPVDNAEVKFLQNGEEKTSTKTTSDGMYQIELAPCTYDVEISKCGVRTSLRIEDIWVGSVAVHNTRLGLDGICDEDGDGYSVNQGDCDDASAAVHPGATDICGNWIDEDCSGAAQSCRYIDNGNGTVTDPSTGLIWQQRDDQVGRKWDDAIAYCNNLSLSGLSGWRLPDVMELEALVEKSSSPVIDPVFTGTNGNYWSASDGYDPSYAWSPSYAYNLNSRTGSFHSASKTDYSLYARCVR